MDAEDGNDCNPSYTPPGTASQEAYYISSELDDNDPSNGVTILSYKRASEAVTPVIDVESYLPNLMNLQRDTSKDEPIDIDTLEPAVLFDTWNIQRRPEPHYVNRQPRSYRCFSEIGYKESRLNNSVPVDLDEGLTETPSVPENTLRCPICMVSAYSKAEHYSMKDDEIAEINVFDSSKSEPSAGSWCATRCGHIFCRRCITSCVSVKKVCPVCRSVLKGKSDLINLYI